MAKIANELKQQMNMEGLKEQAQQCQAIYDKLMEMDGGHLWQRKWDQLVKVCSRRDEKGEVEFYHAPTEIGEIFLKGLAMAVVVFFIIMFERLKLYLCFVSRSISYSSSSPPSEPSMSSIEIPKLLSMVVMSTGSSPKRGE